MTIKKSIASTASVIFIVALVITAVLCLAERDLCLISVCWILGCCGCCADFARDEAKFRGYQELLERELLERKKANAPTTTDFQA